ncbi:uncharacterized protein LOC132750064 [Ruditapes philippinarum]|uniref:uncharacterized protein LOC132750064 n=1 Tax=Ruditapes philippinarum TaxID=129788 RepID=UPI00295B2A38|nr:uncharacterized protein LOC132750064 [Ruditapes philippinarum]
MYWFRHQTLETNICQDIVNVDVKLKALKKKTSLTVVKLEEILDYSEHNELTSTEKGKTSLEITTLRSELTALEKELKPVRFWFNDTLTKSQTTLLTNFIKGNHDFYLDSRYKCRALSNKLETKCNKVKQDDH